MENHEIYMIYGEEYKNMTRHILSESDLIGRIKDKNCRIGIKPNLVSPTTADYGATTHPEIVAGIIEYLQEHGCTQLVILEGSWVGDKTDEAMELCGYKELADCYGVELIDTQKDSHRIYDCGGMELAICDSAKAIEFLINVPVMKGHCQTRITCALKNMKGLIPNQEKRHFHTMGLHKPIAHLGLGLPQAFIVVDNICGDWDFEDGGNPVVMNRIMTAVDPVLCDAYVAHAMKYQVEDVPYIGLAEELGVGSSDLSKLVIHQCNAPEDKVQIPKVHKMIEIQDKVQEVESCSACYGYLMPALNRLREEGLLDNLDTKICIGQGFRGKTGKLGIGTCTRKFENTLEGCPPTPEQMYDFLKKYIQKQ